MEVGKEESNIMLDSFFFLQECWTNTDYADLHVFSFKGYSDDIQESLGLGREKSSFEEQKGEQTISDFCNILVTFFFF